MKVSSLNATIDPSVLGGAVDLPHTSTYMCARTCAGENMLPDTFHNGMEEKKNGSFVFTDPPSLKWVFPACKFEDWGSCSHLRYRVFGVRTEAMFRDRQSDFYQFLPQPLAAPL